ncbi:hypothetical protein [Palleronia marisminoris]|uniref:hypothetical protein n=1 Tax=Palleronia marisminoris TaxID=315423 RepID=UPI00158789E9|nr:hypothetical protein [Palleronia marisminoris]
MVMIVSRVGHGPRRLPGVVPCFAISAGKAPRSKSQSSFSSRQGVGVAPDTVILS